MATSNFRPLERVKFDINICPICNTKNNNFKLTNTTIYNLYIDTKDLTIVNKCTNCSTNNYEIFIKDIGNSFIVSLLGNGVEISYVKNKIINGNILVRICSNNGFWDWVNFQRKIKQNEFSIKTLKAIHNEVLEQLLFQ